MQNGDLSNDFQPCLLVVFEGLLGIPPHREARGKSRWKLRKPTVREQVAEYEINPLMLAKIRQTPYPVEVVTFLGPEFAEAVGDRLDDLHALVRRVWHTTPQELSRLHITMPDVAAIYDPDARRALITYGSLGRHLLPENAPHLGEQ
ncbi:hypothetical protein ACIOHC_35915 [Streptomyces sp. NPDC088252]|uniref:hypothetical protein n=1 Tax=Streptomyces sp. NPDC088252 TaxID=3365845 RepID=UPI0038282C7F